MVSLGFESKSSTIFQMIADLDADGSGVLEFDEWLHLMTNRITDKDSRSNMDKIFSLFDTEKQGAITVENLRNVAATLGEAIDEKELEEMLQRADLNCDGVVDADEFYNIMTRPVNQ
jgi:centrin-1